MGVHLMPGRLEWCLLAYRMPREPSTPRITVWRRLRRLGVAQIVDGLVALPLDARTKERLEWIADEVIEAGGEASVWLGRLGTARGERELAAGMAERIAAEYQTVTDEATNARQEPDATRRRVLKRLRRALLLIGQRDHFPPPQRDAAREAVDRLASLEAVGV